MLRKSYVTLCPNCAFVKGCNFLFNPFNKRCIQAVSSSDRLWQLPLHHNIYILLLLILCLFWGGRTYGQGCTNPTVYWLDSDGDGYGTRDFRTDDIDTAKKDYNDSGFVQGQAGNIIYGCGPFPGYADNHSDCNDNDANAYQRITYYEDNDRDGAGGTFFSGCGSYPTHYVNSGDDCDDNDNTVKGQQTYYRDADGDGAPGTPVQACSQGSYATASTDCNDSDASISAQITWYLDSDGDGKGGSTSQTSCSKPGGNYVTEGGDECDDIKGVTKQNVWYRDKDKDKFGDCNTSVQACEKPDGYVGSCGDLDDNNSAITDVAEQDYYRDADGDGYGNPSIVSRASSVPDGYADNSYDCDDSDGNAYPGATWYFDKDGDGYGSSAKTTTQCLRPSGYVANRSDLDDNNPLITNVSPRNFYQDKDGDGFGNPNVKRFQSYKPTGFVANSKDCDDTNKRLHNASVWSLDQDGDGFGYNPTFLSLTNTDRNTPNHHAPPQGIVPQITGCKNPSTASYTYVLDSSDYDDNDPLISNVRPDHFYIDNDKDGYGTTSNTLFQSKKPDGYVTNNDDCNDTDKTLHPKTVWYRDADGDTYGTVSTTLKQCEQPQGYVRNSADYDDTTIHIYNIKPEYFYRDKDQDRFGDPNVALYYSYKPTGYVRNNTDCNDTDQSINPETVWYPDNDGDSYGTASPTIQQCRQPQKHVRNQDDYDDTTTHIINIKPQNFYQDADGDRYGNPNSILFYSLKPKGYVTNNLDCDDTDKTVNPQKIWYRDEDGDQLGSRTVTTTSCLKPEGYVENSEDLGDGSIYITNIATITFYFDHDKDGFGDPNKGAGYSIPPPDYYPRGLDCNDNDIRVHPNTVWYLDSDGDGFGDKNKPFTGCVPPAYHVLNRADLDDSNPLITDIPAAFFYRDKDGDGYGVDTDKKYQSLPPDGYVRHSGDCDDQDPTLHPATLWYEDRDFDGHGGAFVYQGCANVPPYAQKTATDLDDNTATITDILPQTFFRDKDNDGDGVPGDTYYGSSMPNGYATNDWDCNDNDPLLHHRTRWFLDADGDGFGSPTFITACQKPQGSYVLNEADFDDTTAAITNIKPQTFYRDADEDGYGTEADTRFASHLPEGYVVDKGDCDDTDPLLHPETVWFQDVDGDGFGGDTQLIQCEKPKGFVLNTDDFDDDEPCITNVQPRYFYQDADGDGYGDRHMSLYCSAKPKDYVVNADDCDDTDRAIKPTTKWYRDNDGDGYGIESESITACTPPKGYALRFGDCDDNDPNRLPGAFAAAVDRGMDPYNQVLLTDCNKKEPEPPENRLTAEEEAELQGTFIYADRDWDTFGDPNETLDINQITVVDFNVVKNGDDACPKEFGKYKGCPEPLRVRTRPDSLQNRKIRWFVKDSVPKQKEAKTFSRKELESIQVAPNPTTGLLIARWDADIVGVVVQIRVLGYHHDTEFEVPFSNDQGQSVTINLTSYPDDLYFIQCYLKDGRGVTRKIIKNTKK